MVELIDGLEELRSIFALLPNIGKLIGGSWHLFLEAGPDDALGRIRQRGQEVARRRSLRTIKAHFREICFRSAGVTKVDLPTFVQYDHFVKNLQHGLGGFVHQRPNLHRIYFAMPGLSDSISIPQSHMQPM